MKTVVRGLAAVGLIFVAVVTFRVLVPPAGFEPIGTCIDGDIDLNDPEPFAQLKPSETVVALAASGGGSRAAYLAAAVLREMRRSGVRAETGEPKDALSILSQLDAVSAVSGGALAGGYFVANSAELGSADADTKAWTNFADNMALSFRSRQWYGRALADPRIWAKYLFTSYHRGLLARDDYDATLFKGATTLGDLPLRPALYINAFDVANHVRFVFSRHYINTWFYQPRNAWGKLSAPQELTSENDLSFAKVAPNSVKLADAVTASSAFPFIYPNVALRHCGTKILFQGSRIFLADGALADNSGLLTLMTQLRAQLDSSKGPHRVLVISIDASLNRLDTNGSRFQQRGDEERYAWVSTFFGHGVETIDSAVTLMQDIGWKFLEGTGVETDQINMNWETSLTQRKGTCGPAAKSSWENMFEDGRLSLRPLIIRLGLRDIMNPDFEGQYGASLAPVRQRLDELARLNRITGDWQKMRSTMRETLSGIHTDFVLTDDNRRALDLAAFLLVNGKLASDLAVWNTITSTTAPVVGQACP